MATILVSGASGIVGYGILRSLKGTGCRLIGTTIYDRSPADCFADTVAHPPLTSDPLYLPWLLETIQTYGVDMVIPGIEADMSAWNEHRAALEASGAVVLLNNPELIRLCLDKWRFYEKLQSCGFQYCIPSSIEQTYEIFKPPFLLKPRCGFGGRGIVKVESRADFDANRDEIGKSLMMQEFVGKADEEYTASAFFDRDSNLKAYMVLKRKLSKAGYTEIAETVFPEGLREILLTLADILTPVGPTNFQFRKHNGEWRLLEINPRISSATSIRTAFGYNESKMCVEYFLRGHDIVQPEIRRGKAIRYTEDFITYDRSDL